MFKKNKKKTVMYCVDNLNIEKINYNQTLLSASINNIFFTCKPHHTFLQTFTSHMHMQNYFLIISLLMHKDKVHLKQMDGWGDGDGGGGVIKC